MAGKKGFTRLGEGDLPEKYRVFRGPPVATAAAAPVAKDPDPKLAKENSGLKKQLEEAAEKLAAAEGQTDKLAASASKMEEALAALEAELAEAKEAVSEPVKAVDKIVLHEVGKVRKINDDQSKVKCDFSLGDDEEVLSGEMVVPHSAARQLKRIGSKK